MKALTAAARTSSPEEATVYPDGSRTGREEVRGIYGFTTDMYESEDAGSGTWMWPRPTAATEGYQVISVYLQKIMTLSVHRHDNHDQRD